MQEGSWLETRPAAGIRGVAEGVRAPHHALSLPQTHIAGQRLVVAEKSGYVASGSNSDRSRASLSKEERRLPGSQIDIQTRRVCMPMDFCSGESMLTILHYRKVGLDAASRRIKVQPSNKLSNLDSGKRSHPDRQLQVVGSDAQHFGEFDARARRHSTWAWVLNIRHRRPSAVSSDPAPHCSRTSYARAVPSVRKVMDSATPLPRQACLYPRCVDRDGSEQELTCIYQRGEDTSWPTIPPGQPLTVVEC